MNKPEAHELLDAVRAGVVSIPQYKIDHALRATGDLCSYRAPAKVEVGRRVFWVETTREALEPEPGPQWPFYATETGEQVAA